jgi:hypothetical protein
MKKIILSLGILFCVFFTNNVLAYKVPGCAHVSWNSPTSGTLDCYLACVTCATIWKDHGVWWIDINFCGMPTGITVDEVVDQNGEPTTCEAIESGQATLSSATFKIAE